MQTLQRFAGRVLVATGLAYTLAWMTLPPDLDALVASGIVLAGMLTILARVRLSPGADLCSLD